MSTLAGWQGTGAGRADREWVAGHDLDNGSKK